MCGCALKALFFPLNTKGERESGILIPSALLGRGQNLPRPCVPKREGGGEKVASERKPCTNHPQGHKSDISHSFFQTQMLLCQLSVPDLALVLSEEGRPRASHIYRENRPFCLIAGDFKGTKGPRKIEELTLF